MLKELIRTLKAHNVHYFIAVFLVLYLIAYVSSTSIPDVDDLPHSEAIPKEGYNLIYP